MASGEVSRELVADVMVEAAFAPRAANKVVEIAEEGTFAPGYTPERVERYLVGPGHTVRRSTIASVPSTHPEVVRSIDHLLYIGSCQKILWGKTGLVGAFSFSEMQRGFYPELNIEQVINSVTRLTALALARSRVAILLPPLSLPVCSMSDEVWLLQKLYELSLHG
jgi:hypothetical protein